MEQKANKQANADTPIEEADHDSRRMLDRILQATPDLIYIYSLTEHRNIYANREATHFLGYTPAQVAEMGPALFANLLHPDDVSVVTAHHRLLAGAADGDVHNVQYRMKHSSGQWRWLHSRDTVFSRTPEGKTREIIGIAQDITPQMLAMRSLRKERDFAENLLQMAHALVIVLDPDARIMRFNRYAEQSAGYAESDLTGKPWQDLFPAPVDRERMLDTFLGTVRGRSTQNVISRINVKDGSPKTIRWFFSAIRNSDGGVSAVLALGYDITEILAKEEMFRQAQKMETVGRLAGGVAHDFNNQLTVIKGYAEMLLREQKKGSAACEPLQQILLAATQAASLTTQLLAFSRQQTTHPQAINLRNVLQHMTPLLQQVLAPNIELSVTCPSGLRTFHADPAQMEHVLLNLVNNARDAMPEGGKVAITASNAVLDKEFLAKHLNVQPGPHVLLEVSDTGIGMDEETQRHIFEPFFTTKPVGRGTGLGLSIVYAFVQQIQGHIELHSKPGEGTTFHIFLPCDPPAPSESPVMGLRQWLE